MTTTNVSTASQEATLVPQEPPLIQQEAVKAALLALIKENNPDLKQLLSDAFQSPPFLLGKNVKFIFKPAKTMTKQHLKYKEMPFWKSKPYLKPADATSFAIKKEAFAALVTFFQEPENQITDEWFENLD
jgi:hypothetical protein